MQICYGINEPLINFNGDYATRATAWSCGTDLPAITNQT